MKPLEDMNQDEVREALERAGVTAVSMEKAFARVSRALGLAKVREKLENCDFSLTTPWIDQRPRDKE